MFPLKGFPKYRPSFLVFTTQTSCTIEKKLPYICIVESPQMGNLMGTRIPRLSLWGFNVTPCDTPKIATPFFGLDLAGWRLMVIFFHPMGPSNPSTTITINKSKDILVLWMLCGKKCGKYTISANL